MGYYITLEESNAMIKKDDLPKAYEAMCKLNEHDEWKHGGGWSGNQRVSTWFSWMPADYPDQFKTAREILEALGFECDESAETGNLYITKYDSKTGDQDTFLWACAPYISGEYDGSPYMIWRGEDGEYWKFTFIDGKLYNQPAKIEWQDGHEYQP